MLKPKYIVSVRRRTSKRAAAIVAATLFSNDMKKFIRFITILSLLIVSEYYFLTEVFSQRRVFILIISLLVIFACIYGLVRFFKRSFISS